MEKEYIYSCFSLIILAERYHFVPELPFVDEELAVIFGPAEFLAATFHFLSVMCMTARTETRYLPSVVQ